ncbi:MAG: DUF1802 family protein [Phormidesmis sp.]
MQIKTALKEWSVAVDALAQGETIMLLRKGGIKEQQGKFSAEADRAVLFPTFEHQKPELLKPQYRARVKPVEKGWHPQTITLKAWADITHIFLTDEADKVEALSAFHIWQAQLAQERLKWKPKQPLYVLTLRVYRFAEPIAVSWQATYGGCKSWIGLAQGVEAQLNEPVIEGDCYDEQVADIAHVLQANPAQAARLA